MDFAGRFGVERHAEQCYGCGKAMKDAVRLGRMVRELERTPAPPGFESAIMSRIGKGNARRRASIFWKWWVYGTEQLSWRALAVGAAGTIIVGLGIVTTVRYTEPDRTASGPARSESRTAGLDAPIADGGEWAAPLSGRQRQVAPLRIINPKIVALGDPRARYDPDSDWPNAFLYPVESGYVDYPLPGPGDQKVIMRLPRSIRLKYSQGSEEHFLRFVSH
ncbi:MAG: hypothetical protein ABIG68_08645 [Acidobacteriota bacterium]